MQSTQDRVCWQGYHHGTGVTAIYGPDERLAAVAVDANTGPLVRLREVELIARVPSEVRAEVHALAGREGVPVGVNWSGDPEVAAWGVSMGADQEWGTSPDGYLERRDAMLTGALLVGPELAEDPYGAEPVLAWRDVRRLETNSGSWPVTSDQNRPRWDWTPLERVGPLRFGMRPRQVAAALGGETPAARRGWGYQSMRHYGARQWILSEDQFDRAGVTAHYWYQQGFPTLAAVTVNGRTGPQLEFEGLPLIGRTVSEVDAALTRYVESHDGTLLIGCDGDLGPDGSGMSVRATRAGDTVVSGARFHAEDWDDHG
ncbi:hypothetical protein ACFY2K_02425 [Kitasatospora sp. NPDC001309]|uniref:hypothetical protein n=1 Tax=Kitasatospora sp. NPDC001309 TaxID=3364013 RepID=UPI003697FC86